MVDPPYVASFNGTGKHPLIPSALLQRVLQHLPVFNISGQGNNRIQVKPDFGLFRQVLLRASSAHQH